MAIVKILARDMDCYINTGTTATPTWKKIDYTQVTANWSVTNADTTTQSNGGWSAHLPALRSATFTVEGKYLVDPVTGDRDPAQLYLETLAHQVSRCGMGEFWFVFKGRACPTIATDGTITPPGADTALGGLKFSGSVSVTAFGGSNQDAAQWNAEITMDGSPSITDGTSPESPGT